MNIPELITVIGTDIGKSHKTEAKFQRTVQKLNMIHENHKHEVLFNPKTRRAFVVINGQIFTDNISHSHISMVDLDHANQSEAGAIIYHLYGKNYYYGCFSDINLNILDDGGWIFTSQNCAPDYNSSIIAFNPDVQRCLTHLPQLEHLFQSYHNFSQVLASSAAPPWLQDYFILR